MEGNDETRLQALYTAHRPVLLRIATDILRSPHDAEDALHEVFFRVARHLDHLREDSRGYLVAVTRNVCHDELRRRQRRQAWRASTVAAADAEELAVDAVVAGAVWRALSRRERRLLLDAYAGYTQDEMAARFGMTRAAVSVALVRARQHARMIAASARGAAAVPFQVASAALRRGLDRLRTSLSAASSTPLGGLPEVMIGGIAMATLGGLGGSGEHVPDATALQPQSIVAPAAVATASRHGPDGLLGSAALLPGVGAAAPGHGLRTTTPDDVPGRQDPESAQGFVQNNLRSNLAPSQGARQEDGKYTNFTVSPDYQHDHTAFAAGNRYPCLTDSNCGIVARTTDSGTTWTVLAGQGYLPGAIMLPPDFPSDRTLFAAGPNGLQRSDDAGATFATVVPGGVTTALDPLSPRGDPHVLLATNPLTVYDAATRTVHPGPLLPPTDSNVGSIAYAPDGTLFVVAPAAQSSSNVQASTDALRCPPASGCTTVLSDPQSQSYVVMVSPGYAADRTVMLFSPPNSIGYVSVDGGSTFREFVLPPNASYWQAFLIPRPQPPASLVVAAMTSDPNLSEVVLESDDGGRSTHAVTTFSPHGVDFADAVVLPDRILVALSNLDGTGGVGVRCSQDGGATWRHSCIA